MEIIGTMWKIIVILGEFIVAGIGLMILIGIIRGIIDSIFGGNKND